MNVDLVEESFLPSIDKKSSFSKEGMVSSAFPDATKAGVEILRKGGNAFDAGCAVALALGVCEPQASGIGGQSMAIIYSKKKVIAIDGSSRSPSLTHHSLFKLKRHRKLGYKATTVPSTLAALGHIHKMYGRLEWQEIVRPSIRIAHRGYKITQLQHNLQIREFENFMKIKSKSGAKYFLKDGEVPYNTGDIFIQEDLAETLRSISANGYGTFYRGEIAKKIEEFMIKNHGLIRQSDLAAIQEPVERKPISKRYRDIRIATLPPPAAGRTMLMVLMMLNYIPSEFLKNYTPVSIHFIAETFRKAFLHRIRTPSNSIAYDKLHLSRTFVKHLVESIPDTMGMTIPIIEPKLDGDDTTHLSVMDNEGNAIGITQSINNAYGSKVAADGLGFLYNSYMSAFRFKNVRHPYFIKPNATPFTSVSPSLVFYGDKLWMVLGSTGSERIFSTISYFLSKIVDENLSINEAIMRPRFHCSIGRTISFEEGAFSKTILDYLKHAGYLISKKERYSFYHGAIHAVLKKLTSEGFQGTADVRRDGTAEGP